MSKKTKHRREAAHAAIKTEWRIKTQLVLHMQHHTEDLRWRKNKKLNGWRPDTQLNKNSQHRLSKQKEMRARHERFPPLMLLGFLVSSVLLFLPSVRNFERPNIRGKLKSISPQNILTIKALGRDSLWRIMAGSHVLWFSAGSLTQCSVASWRLILSSGLVVFLFSFLFLAAASSPNNCSLLHHKSFNPGIFIILWSRCCKTYSTITMQCQPWHIADVLHAVTKLDNPWPFTDCGQFTGLQMQTHQRSIQLGPHAAYTHTHTNKHRERENITLVVMTVQYENTTWTNGLIKARTMTFWMSEGVRGVTVLFSCCWTEWTWTTTETHNWPLGRAQPRALITGAHARPAAGGPPLINRGLLFVPHPILAPGVKQGTL